MDSVSRRAVVAAAAAGSVPTAAHAARFGNPDEPPQGERSIPRTTRQALPIRGRKTRRSVRNSPAPSRRPRRMSATCRCFGPRSTMRRAASRMAVGRARSRRPIFKSPSRFPASTCATGSTSRGGVSLPRAYPWAITPLVEKRVLFGIWHALPGIPHLHRGRRLFITASSAGRKFARSLRRSTGVGGRGPFRSTIQSLCFQRGGDDIRVGEFWHGSIRHDRLPGLGSGFAWCRARRGGR
jgi:hypothetical protein